MILAYLVTVIVNIYRALMGKAVHTLFSGVLYLVSHLIFIATLGRNYSHLAS